MSVWFDPRFTDYDSAATLEADMIRASKRAPVKVRAMEPCAPVALTNKPCPDCGTPTPSGYRARRCNPCHDKARARIQEAQNETRRQDRALGRSGSASPAH